MDARAPSWQTLRPRSAADQAVAAKKDEKQFAESLTRISRNNLGYTRLKTMLLAVNSR